MLFRVLAERCSSVTNASPIQCKSTILHTFTLYGYVTALQCDQIAEIYPSCVLIFY